MFIEREMALTLEHLARTRKRTKKILGDLEYADEGPANRMANLRPLPHEYSSDLWVQRDKIRNQLRTIRSRLAAQKNRIIVEYEREMQVFEMRLLDLLAKHEHVQFHNGHKRNFEKT